MTAVEQILQTLSQTNVPVTSKLVGSIKRVLAEHAAILDQIRAVTGLYHCDLADLPGAIEDIISNMATQNVILSEDGPTGPNPTIDEIMTEIGVAYASGAADQAAEYEETCRRG